MECRNKCGNESVGRSKYCGDACKVSYNRNKKSGVVGKSVTSVTENAPASKSVTSGLRDYVESESNAYIKVVSASPLTQHERQCDSNNDGRHRKQSVNLGPWKSMDELRRQEIDLGMVEHNRVSLPGDGDYVGAADDGYDWHAKTYGEADKIFGETVLR